MLGQDIRRVLYFAGLLVTGGVDRNTGHGKAERVIGASKSGG